MRPRPLISLPLAVRSVDDLRARLADHGARPAHVRRILTAWLAGRPPTPAPRDARSARARGRTPRSSNALEAALPSLAQELAARVTEVSRHPADDGSCRRLLRLLSGRTIESVDLPRDGLCVSTQVGCAVGCRFCRTGEEGLLEQLSAIEILAQVALARRTRPVRRVVFMGMGEPAHNLHAVLDAIAALGDEGRFAHKNLVFSTVGEERVFDRLRQSRVRPGLALSLHTLDADVRADLLPHAPPIDPEALLEAGLAYADDTTYPLLVQWTLLDGVNDGADETARLAELLKRRRAIVNYIPFNSVEGSGYERPPIARCVDRVRQLQALGVRATLRRSAGQDVEAGCGQLRARQAKGDSP